MRATLRLSSPAWLAQPKIDVVDPVGRDLGPRDQRGDHLAAEVVGADPGQAAAVAAERGANTVDEIGRRASAGP